MAIEFESPAARVIEQFSGKKESEFRIPVDLPDISFLRALSIQGRLRYFISSGGAVTITPNEGETLFVYKIVVSGSDAAADATVTVTNDGQIREFSRIKSAASLISILGLTMDSLVGNSIKTFTVTATQGEVAISVFGWVENTSRIRDVTI